MSKRAMLWSVGLGVFAIFYLGAANIPHDSWGVWRCQSLNIFEWFGIIPGRTHSYGWHAAGCDELIFPRLSALIFGLIALVIFGYFAEKSSSRPPLFGGHYVTRDASSGLFKCRHEGCDFKSSYRDVAREHRIATGAVLAKGSATLPLTRAAAPAPIAGNSYGFDSLGQRTDQIPSAQATASPGLKACPDCAEEVRAAARKCRFCGYLFSEVSAESS
jgi:hypothetical protein